ncbi:MAG: SDR family oxidoreductase [Pseudomonadales bacterium]|nr:SDR family oxidoreductase [Pseudomonadales bacterium]
MKTLIIGANGKIGKALAEKMVKKGIDTRAMVRSKDQIAQFEEMGLEAVVGNLEGEMSEAFVGCDAIVFTAGSGSGTGADKTLMVDLWGSIRAIDIAQEHNVKLFIMVSSLKSCDPLRGPEKIRHYLVARHCADDHLSRSTLNFNLLRPGRLLDEESAGQFSGSFDWSDTVNAYSTISREDVANIIVELLLNPLPSGTTVDMIKGDIEQDEFLKSYR